jgi:hypothetical protein
MSSVFRSLSLSAFGAAILCLSSCGESQKPAAVAPAAANPSATEVRYECPMGCAGSQSNKPGKCPTCEMDLEKKS